MMEFQTRNLQRNAELTERMTHIRNYNKFRPNALKSALYTLIDCHWWDSFENNGTSPIPNIPLKAIKEIGETISSIKMERRYRRSRIPVPNFNFARYIQGYPDLHQYDLENLLQRVYDELENPPMQDPDYENVFGGDEETMIIKEVHENGWTLIINSWRASSSDSIFVRLPKSIAKIARVGTEFSFFDFASRNGEWRPNLDSEEKFIKIEPPGY